MAYRSLDQAWQDRFPAEVSMPQADLNGRYRWPEGSRIYKDDRGVWRGSFITNDGSRKALELSGSDGSVVLEFSSAEGAALALAILGHGPAQATYRGPDKPLSRAEEFRVWDEMPGEWYVKYWPDLVRSAMTVFPDGTYVSRLSGMVRPVQRRRGGVKTSVWGCSASLFDSRGAGAFQRIFYSGWEAAKALALMARGPFQTCPLIPMREDSTGGRLSYHWVDGSRVEFVPYVGPAGSWQAYGPTSSEPLAWPDTPEDMKAQSLQPSRWRAVALLMFHGVGPMLPQAFGKSAGSTAIQASFQVESLPESLPKFTQEAADSLLESLAESVQELCAAAGLTTWGHAVDVAKSRLEEFKVWQLSKGISAGPSQSGEIQIEQAPLTQAAEPIVTVRADPPDEPEADGPHVIEDHVGCVPVAQVQTKPPAVEAQEPVEPGLFNDFIGYLELQSAQVKRLDRFLMAVMLNAIEKDRHCLFCGGRVRRTGSHYECQGGVSVACGLSLPVALVEHVHRHSELTLTREEVNEVWDGMLVRADERMRATFRPHQQHRCDVEGCQICSGGLSLCTVCGGGEASLPTECPGRRLTPPEEAAIMSWGWDFIDGKFRQKGIV